MALNVGGAPASDDSGHARYHWARRLRHFTRADRAPHGKANPSGFRDPGNVSGGFAAGQGASRIGESVLNRLGNITPQYKL